MHLDLNLLIAIYIVLGLIALIGVVLNIISIIQIYSKNSSIDYLQIEIEKINNQISLRQREKKEGVSKPYDSYAEQTEQNPPLAITFEDPQKQFEVFRNFPTQFLSTSQQTQDKKEHPSTATREHNQAPLPYPSGQQPYPSGQQPYPSGQQVSESLSQPHRVSSEIRLLTIPLFSPSSKDADFKSLWERARIELTKYMTVHLTIDFNHILFLYGQELDYLHKLYGIISTRGGTVSFVNCSPDIVSLLGRDPTLRSLLNKR